jgi:hypothetical protein
MEIINITNSKIVLEEVGKISEAMRLADEPAGDAKRNRMTIVASLEARSSS